MEATITINMPQFIARGRRTGLYEIAKNDMVKKTKRKNDYGEDGQIKKTNTCKKLQKKGTTNELEKYL